MYENVSASTCQWLLQVRKKHGEVPIIEIVVCAKAMRLATLLNKPNFEASKEWLACWKNLYELSVF